MGVGLPSEYKEILYIESSGTQWLNTGIFPSESPYFKMQFRMQPTSFKESYNYFYGTSGNWMSFEKLGSSFPFNTGSTTGMFSGLFSISLGQIVDFDITYDSGTMTIAGYYEGSRSYSGQLGAGVLGFFARANGESFSSERLFYLKLYQGEDYELVRDFVPCIRKIDNKPGVYDLVSNEFYTSAGVEDFIAGQANSDILATDLVFRRRLLTRPAKQKLPSDYQEVEYIEQTGTQWIDTGIIPDEDTVSHIKFMNLAVTGNVIYGFYDSETTSYRMFNASGTCYFDVPTGSNSTYRHYGGRLNAMKIWQLEIGNHYVKDRETGNYFFNSSGKEFVSNIKSITLGMNRPDTSSPTSNNRWYSVQIYNNQGPVFIGVPCYRKQDDKPGMYDFVSKTFLTNVGTGEFVVGPDIN